VGNALDAGIDMATVANIAGHASTDTTRRYDRRGERAKEQATHKLDLPI
jgi:integrase